MILFVEGPRACGKTYLINDFLKEVNPEPIDNEKYPLEPVFKPAVDYYKFYFADHIKTLGLESLDNTPALHYFSLGNIMTILEMNQYDEYSDKIWVFDRAIISAYVWSVLRGRLTPVRARKEYEILVNSDLYSNCKTIMITTEVDRSNEDKAREKDFFDGTHSTEEELHQFGHFLDFGKAQLSDSSKNNALSIIVNRFDQASTDQFIREGRLLLELPA